ncbi:MAG: type II toxin-antitoxin system PemK/MazF family toxin [Deltaproteobacteria bacterium]|nr:MAG: type II toxin-antitoxin system PemK/MazF family toxin [Deltaproteobacteria bacterium]
MIARGDIWLVDLDPTRGHEQKGKRPVLVISENAYNNGLADLVIILPITSTQRAVPTQVHLNPPEGGLKHPSAILCDAIRSVSKERLIKKWGHVLPRTLSNIETRLKILMGLY